MHVVDPSEIKACVLLVVEEKKEILLITIKDS